MFPSLYKKIKEGFDLGRRRLEEQQRYTVVGEKANVK